MGNLRRFMAIGVVWLGCALAWMVLGTTVVERSGERGGYLSDEVHALWGPPMVQRPLRATYADPWPPVRDVADPKEAVGPPAAEPSGARTTSDEGVLDETASSVVTAEVAQPEAVARPRAGPSPGRHDLSLLSSDVNVELELEHRKKGLVWFPTYAVDFAARYSVKNPFEKSIDVEFELPLESSNVLYDGLEVTDAGKSIDAVVEGGVVKWSGKLAPGEKREVTVGYHSHGTSSWRYEPTEGTGQVKNFNLSMATSFSDVDFPAGTISPTSHDTRGEKWNGTWAFKSLVSSAPIGVELPQKLNPGPLVAKITFFAPVSLLFFFFVVAVLTAHRRIDIHPLNYFFIGCAFFAFNLLFAYLVDHLAVLPSFSIASAVSVALVVSYSRLFTGWKFALLEIGLSQLVYLVLFSFTFFWTGFTGLAITVGAILTLFVMMQITGRNRWSSDKPQNPRGVCPTPYRCAAEQEVDATPVAAG